jgi:protein-S-isoprenylcysteine O-methyltransferase Ste14
MSKSNKAPSLYRWRVRAGTPVAIAVILFSHPTPGTLLAGLALSFLGLAVRSWAAGHLKKEKELAVSGPYRHTRNPLYFGNIIIGTGMAVGCRSWIVWIVLAAYFLVFYPVVISVERDRMRALFTEAYAAYEKAVPALLPSFRKYEGGSAAAFDPALHRKNREFRAILGTMVFWVFLLAKMKLIG